MARVGDGVNRMTKANHHFFVFNAFTDIRFRFVWRFVALLDLQRYFIRPAVFRTTQCANRADNRGIHIGSGPCNHAAGEGGGVEFVFGVQHQRNMHRFFPASRRLFAMQQMQEVAANGIIVSFRLNTLAVMAVVIPVQENRTERCQQLVGNIACTGDGVPFFFRQRTAQRGDAGAHHVHRVRGSRQRFQNGTHVCGQSAQRF